MPRNYYRRPDIDMSVATMEAAIASMVAFPDKLARSEVAKIVEKNPGVSATRLHNARLVIKRKPELIDGILAGKMSLYLAYEITTKGSRVTCPTCKGSGYIHQ